jgi:hypothetical protein
VDGGERGRKRVDGTPVFRREEGQTDLAGREGDVRVGYPGCEVDCWWCEGVVWWDCDSEVPEAAWRSCYVSTDAVVTSLSLGCGGGLPRPGVYLRMESRLRL